MSAPTEPSPPSDLSIENELQSLILRTFSETPYTHSEANTFDILDDDDTDDIQTASDDCFIDLTEKPPSTLTTSASHSSSQSDSDDELEIFDAPPLVVQELSNPRLAQKPPQYRSREEARIPAPRYKLSSNMYSYTIKPDHRCWMRALLLGTTDTSPTDSEILDLKKELEYFFDPTHLNVHQLEWISHRIQYNFRPDKTIPSNNKWLRVSEALADHSTYELIQLYRSHYSNPNWWGHTEIEFEFFAQHHKRMIVICDENRTIINVLGQEFSNSDSPPIVLENICVQKDGTPIPGGVPNHFNLLVDPDFIKRTLFRSR